MLLDHSSCHYWARHQPLQPLPAIPSKPLQHLDFPPCASDLFKGNERSAEGVYLLCLPSLVSNRRFGIGILDFLNSEIIVCDESYRHPPSISFCASPNPVIGSLRVNLGWTR